MVTSIDTQLTSLIISVFAGLMVGLLFDLYRTINFYARPPKAFLYFMDLLFWIITGIMVFTVLLSAEFANLRIYTFAGMGIGLLIYIKLFSEYVLKFYRGVIYIITKIVRLIFITMTLPFKLLYNVTWSPLHSTGFFIKDLYSKGSRKVSAMLKLNKKK